MAAEKAGRAGSLSKTSAAAPERPAKKVAKRKVGSPAKKKATKVPGGVKKKATKAPASAKKKAPRASAGAKSAASEARRLRKEGDRYYRGEGVAEDFVRARALYRQAAELGDVDAMGTWSSSRRASTLTSSPASPTRSTTRRTRPPKRTHRDFGCFFGSTPTRR